MSEADRGRETVAVAGLRDFPEFLGAVAVKELRQGVRGKMFVVPFIGIHIAMLMALGFDYAAAQRGGAPGGLITFLLNAPLANLGAQRAFWQVAFLLLLVVTPWAGLTNLTREIEGGQGEFLLLAGLSRWRVVLGKWAVLCALGMLTAITLLPYLLVRYFLGAMNVPLTMAIALTLVMLNATANALALGLSGYTSVGTRITVAVCTVISFYISTMIVGLSSAYAGNEIVSSGKDIAATVGGLLGIAGSCLVYCALGLQLGRMRIRTYERPFESATSGGVVALIILMPIILGFAAMLTMGYAAILGALFLAWAVVAMDPAPKPRAAPLAGDPAQTEVGPPTKSGFPNP